MKRYFVAAIELARLAITLRFRLRGAYMRWRLETAFGHDEAKMPSRAERWRSVIEYANWCAAMRKLTRRRG